MRWAWVSYHCPDPEGTAAGRQLWALGEALLAAGHEVTAWCWRPREPQELPSWASWSPVPAAAAWRTRTRALALPRTEVVRSGWTPPDGAVVVADDPGSWPAVSSAEHPVAQLHYSVALDRRALADWSPAHVQDWRAERRAAGARTVWTLSARVAELLGGRPVPATLPLPRQVVDHVDRPVVSLLADWSWAPNRRAADLLLQAWPEVRDRVPGAELLLAGRGQDPLGALAGARWLGEVRSTTDLLAQTAVFAFPCPPTSGPKMKVLDALGHGVTVLTTEAGAEGVRGPGPVVVPQHRLADRLVELLNDPQARAEVAARGRRTVLAQHAPARAAEARVQAWSAVAAARAGR